ncbi:MAG: WD40/YVTN/BNR-like repeat-containing protein [Candidatus Promineifilaceae bacterium]
MGSLPANATIHSVTVDPNTPQRVYAAGPAGLFRSDDAGLTWAPADAGLSNLPVAVTLDPAVPQTIFTLLADGSVWRSPDGAATWAPLEGGA